jgi:hypothetical protein
LGGVRSRLRRKLSPGGALSRVIPRFGTFTLAFPLAFAAALIATALVVPLAAGNAPPPMLTIPGMVK